MPSCVYPMIQGTAHHGQGGDEFESPTASGRPRSPRKQNTEDKPRYRFRSPGFLLCAEWNVAERAPNQSFPNPLLRRYASQDLDFPRPFEDDLLEPAFRFPHRWVVLIHNGKKRQLCRRPAGLVHRADSGHWQFPRLRGVNPFLGKQSHRGTPLRSLPVKRARH